MLKAWRIGLKWDHRPDNEDFIYVDESGRLNKDQVKEQVLLQIYPDQYRDHETMGQVMHIEPVKVFGHTLVLNGA